MSQSIEIEYKNMLTRQEFELLINVLPYKSKFIQQKNHYFDTDSFKLQQLHSALRIREANQQYTLTLKEPAHIGSLETNEIIDATTMKQWLNNQPLSTPIISERLQQFSISYEDLKYFGFLITERTLYQVSPEIVIALDHSFYHELEDYELEVEGLEDQATKQFFQSLLQTYKIPARKTEPKIRRFFNNI